MNLVKCGVMLQDDHRAFRRQLEDKRPVVEYIASEPPLSDTSDTECECTLALVIDLLIGFSADLTWSGTLSNYSDGI